MTLKAFWGNFYTWLRRYVWVHSSWNQKLFRRLKWCGLCWYRGEKNFDLHSNTKTFSVPFLDILESLWSVLAPRYGLIVCAQRWPEIRWKLRTQYGARPTYFSSIPVLRINQNVIIKGECQKMSIDTSRFPYVGFILDFEDWVTKCLLACGQARLDNWLGKFTMSERCPVFCQHRPDSLTPHVVVGTLHHSHPEALRRRSQSTRSFQD